MDGSQFKAFAQGLFKSSALADFEIKCCEDIYQVHRVILACHSRYFKALFEGDYAESSKRSIELKDDNPHAVKLMIDYFYGFDYDDSLEDIMCFSNPLELNAAVYTVADKYEVPDLKKLAVKHFTLAAPHSALRHENPLEAIRIAFTGTLPTDRALRDVVLDYWTTFAKVLFNDRGPAISASVVQEVPEFAVELMLRGAGEVPGEFVASCSTSLYNHESLCVDTVEQVFTKSCKICRRLMSEHKSLLAHPPSKSHSPFWVKALD